MQKISWKIANKNVIAGGCVAASLLAVLATMGMWAPALLLAPVVGYGTAHLRYKYVASLQARANTPNSVEWDVELNGVKVGTVSDADYAAIRLQVFGDIWLYLAQVANVGRILLRIADSMITSIPIVAFWAMLGLGVFAPDQCAIALADLRSVTPAEIALFAHFVFGSMMVVGLLATAINVALLGANFGFVNQFSEAIALKLRHKLGVAAEGHLKLVRWYRGELIFNDEGQGPFGVKVSAPTETA
jgi:hypothetical protein